MRGVQRMSPEASACILQAATHVRGDAVTAAGRGAALCGVRRRGDDEARKRQVTANVCHEMAGSCN